MAHGCPQAPCLPAGHSQLTSQKRYPSRLPCARPPWTSLTPSPLWIPHAPVLLLHSLHPGSQCTFVRFVACVLNSKHCDKGCVLVETIRWAPSSPSYLVQEPRWLLGT